MESGGRTVLRAVATDGHRLARVETDAPAAAAGIPGVIVPRKAVTEILKLLDDAGDQVTVELSPSKIRLTLGAVVLTSKLIDGTFPDYQRVIPSGNDKSLTVDKEDFKAAVDRVSTISSERGRAVKMALADGRLTLSVTNPDSGVGGGGAGGRLRGGVDRHRFQRALPPRYRQPARRRHRVVQAG